MQALTERKIFDSIPRELNDSWIISYLFDKKFTASHIRILKSKTNFSDKILSNILNIAPKTLSTYTKDVSNAKIDTKEHVLMLIAMIKHGTDVFGSETNFNKWLDSPNIFFDNSKPISYLNTVSGIRFIDNSLTSMEYGDNI